MPTVLAALSAYNQSVAHHLTADQALTQTQKTLTGQTDLAAWQQQLDRASPAHKALLLSEAEPGGWAFLAAVPVACKRLEPAVFLGELRHRLHLPEAAADEWCPNLISSPCTRGSALGTHFF